MSDDTLEINPEEAKYENERLISKDSKKAIFQQNHQTKQQLKHK